LREFKKATEIKIFLVDEELDFSKVKKKHARHEGERLLKVSRIMGRNIEISNEKVLTQEQIK
jgi:hypothetical protein